MDRLFRTNTENMALEEKIQQTVKDAVLPEIESIHRKLGDFTKPHSLDGFAKMLEVSEHAI